MNFIIAADTDVGTSKSINQDSCTVKLLHTSIGDMVFAVMCDGMGGLSDGEVASASVLAAYDRWMREQLPQLCINGIDDSQIREQWTNIAVSMNRLIASKGSTANKAIGTTAVVMLITGSRYYVMNVGDSRAYEIGNSVVQLTHDQSFVAREVAQGRMTEEEARVHPNRNVLLQCIGASDAVYPEMVFGDVSGNCTYMICSDGFRHELSDEEMYSYLCAEASYDAQTMQQNIRYLINLNMQRMERDNITVILIKAEEE